MAFVLEWQQQDRDPRNQSDSRTITGSYSKIRLEQPWNLVIGKKKIEEESSKDEKLKKEKKEKKGGIKKDFKLIANSREGK